jgi:hypothetical protein
MVGSAQGAALCYPVVTLTVCASGQSLSSHLVHDMWSTSRTDTMLPSLLRECITRIAGNHMLFHVSIV